MSTFGWAAIVVAVLIQLADVWTTVIVLNQGGREVGFAALFVRWGWPRWLWMGLPKAVAAAWAVLAYFQSGEPAMIVVLAIFSALASYAVVNNWRNIRWGGH